MKEQQINKDTQAARFLLFLDHFSSLFFDCSRAGSVLLRLPVFVYSVDLLNLLHFNFLRSSQIRLQRANGVQVIGGRDSDGLGGSVFEHESDSTSVVDLAALESAVGRDGLSDALGHGAAEAESLHDVGRRRWGHDGADSVTIELSPDEAIVVLSLSLGDILHGGVAQSEGAAFAWHVLSAREDHLLVGDHQGLAGSLLDAKTAA